MKTWCYRHPTVTFIALVAWMLFNALWFIYRLNHQQWAWMALSLFCITTAVHPAIRWWDRM